MKKTDHGGRQGPKFGAPQQARESSSSGQKRYMSTMIFLSYGEKGHYAGQCPKKKKKQGGSTTTVEEIEFEENFVRECNFVTTFSVVTPSIIIWGDRVDEE
jgi:hypothetical protein